MTKLIFIPVLTFVFLTACSNASPAVEVPITHPEVAPEISDVTEEQTPELPSFETSYLPAEWKQEAGFENVFYSPEMWGVREGGPYSLYIAINGDSSSIQDYLTRFYSTADPACLEQKAEFTLNGHPALSYSTSCGNIPSQVTLMEIDGFLVEGTSYSFSDETQEINKILSSLVLTTKQNATK